MTKRFFAVVVILILPFILAACVPSLGSKSKTPVAGQFVKGGVVGGFPENLPLFKGARVSESYGGEDAYGAAFIADEDVGKVVNFYNSALPQLGWQSTLSASSETSYVFAIKNDTYSGTVVVNTASDGKKTAITMAVSVR